jgi:hypothetical protein
LWRCCLEAAVSQVSEFFLRGNIIGKSVERSTRKVHSAVNKAVIATKKAIILNESESVYIDFTNKKIRQQLTFHQRYKVPYANTAIYLRMTLNANCSWKEHIKKKYDEFNIKFRKCIGCLDAILSFLKGSDDGV